MSLRTCIVPIGCDIVKMYRAINCLKSILALVRGDPNQIVDLEPIQLNPRGITRTITGMLLILESTVPDKKQRFKTHHF